MKTPTNFRRPGQDRVLTRSMQAVLYDIQPSDPATLAEVVMVLLGAPLPSTITQAIACVVVTLPCKVTGSSRSTSW